MGKFNNCITHNEFVFIIGLIKEGSAAFLSLVKALAVPLTTVFFSQKWIMGVNAARLSFYLLIGGLVICLGLLAFAYGSWQAEKSRQLTKLQNEIQRSDSKGLLSSASPLDASINLR